MIRILLITLSLLFATETREKVAILDTGISSQFPHEYLCEEQVDFTGDGMEDPIKHGTLIAYILSDYINPKTQCLLILRYWKKDISLGNGIRYTNGLKYIIENEVIAYLNLSLSGSGRSYWEELYLRELLERGVVIFNAAGNDGINLSSNCSAFPACYNLPKNFFVVASRVGNVLSSYSNYGGPVNRYADGNVCRVGICMHGTSLSCAVSLGEYILSKRQTRIDHKQEGSNARR